MEGNRYKQLLNGDKLFTISDGKYTSVCTITNKGKIIYLKKYLSKKDAVLYITNRANKKKLHKNYKIKTCQCCGVHSRDVKPRHIIFSYGVSYLCSKCSRTV